MLKILSIVYLIFFYNTNFLGYFASLTKRVNYYASVDIALIEGQTYVHCTGHSQTHRNLTF